MKRIYVLPSGEFSSIHCNVEDSYALDNIVNLINENEVFYTELEFKSKDFLNFLVILNFDFKNTKLSFFMSNEDGSFYFLHGDRIYESTNPIAKHEKIVNIAYKYNSGYLSLE